MALPEERRPAFRADDYHGHRLVSWPTLYPPSQILNRINCILHSCALIIVFAVLNVLYLKWATVQKQKRRAELLAPYADDISPDGGSEAWTELGDRHPDFQYAL